MRLSILVLGRWPIDQYQIASSNIASSSVATVIVKNRVNNPVVATV